MSIFRFFSKQSSAPTARDRLQVLLAHERATVGQTDLIAVLREEILAVIAKHVEIDDERVSVKMDRGEHVTTLEVDIEIPITVTVRAA